MAKPSWITVVSGSTGSGSGTRSLKASSHTGRSSRSGSIKGVTSGGASDSVVISQDGASEFIMVDKTSYSVTALGGTVKITGTSNSPSLKIYQLSDPSSLSNFALKVNGTAYTWNGSSSHIITGDPGASASYTFEISFDVWRIRQKSLRILLSSSPSRVIHTHLLKPSLLPKQQVRRPMILMVLVYGLDTLNIILVQKVVLQMFRIIPFLCLGVGMVKLRVEEPSLKQIPIQLLMLMSMEAPIIHTFGL